MSGLVRRGSKVPPAAEVSIVIPVLERVDRLSACLRSLAALNPLQVHEVIVVANGTPESALAMLPEPSRLVIVPSSVNLGFAGGCNWGARFARGRHLVLLNDDTEVEPGWLHALVKVAETDPRIGAVGSRLLEPDGTLQEAGSVLWSDAGTYQVGRGLPAGSGAFDRVRNVDYCSACGLLVRRSAWDAVGGFDEGYFPAYHEDVDLCLALLSHGFRTVYAPQARLRHYRGASLENGLRRVVGRRSGQYFISKWSSALSDYEPHPSDRGLEAGVTAAILRAERRQVRIMISPITTTTGASRSPTEMDLVRSQLRALRSALDLRNEYIATLEQQLSNYQQRGPVRWLVRVPAALPRAVGWAARHLPGARTSRRPSGEP